MRSGNPTGRARSTFPLYELCSTPFGRVPIHPRASPWNSALRVIRILQRTLLLIFGLVAALSISPPVFADGEDITFGGPGTGDGQFSIYVRGLATDSAGNIYVLDGGKVDAGGSITGGNFLVQKFDSTGTYLSKFSVYDAALGANNTPTRIDVSDAGEVFVLITNANQVRRYVNGTLTTTYSVPTSQTPLYQDTGDGGEVNVGGIFVREIAGVTYLYVVRNDGLTVSKINVSTSSDTSITLSKSVTSVKDLAVDVNQNIYILCDDNTSGFPNLIMKFNSSGTWQKSYGSGVWDSSAYGHRTGDVPRHDIDVDSSGNVYSVSPENEAKMLKYAFGEGLIYYRQGQFQFADPYSIHGNEAYLTVDSNNRVYYLTTHSNDGTGYYHASPCVIRVVADYFDLGAGTREVGTIGLNAAYEHNLPYNISYSLTSIPYDFVLKPAVRVVSDLVISYNVYDVYKTAADQGSFTLTLTDGVEARKSLSFLPSKWGWYSATFDMYDGVQSAETYLMSTAVYFGVTPEVTGMPTLVEGEAPVSWNDVPRQAWAGLPLLRINSTMDPTSVQTILNDAVTYGVTIIVQFVHQDDLAGLVDFVTQFQGQVKYYEIINEPDLNMDAATYLSYLTGAYNDIKSIDPAAKVMGPATCGVNLGWIDAFYAAGGKNYTDILSTHTYEGNESMFPEHWRWKFGQLWTIMDNYGDGAKPIWQTEHGFTVIRGGSFLGPVQAARLTLHSDLLDSLGIARPNDFYYYLNEGGYAAYPAYLWSKTGPHPGALAIRTRYAMTRGTLPTIELDFGPTGNKIFLGLRYTVDGSNLVVLRNYGADPISLTLGVTSGATLTVVDCFGNEEDKAVAGGEVTLDVPILPIYLKLATGQDIVAPNIDYGENKASSALFSYTSTYSGSWSILTNGIFETLHPSYPYTTWWIGTFDTAPQTLEITFPSAKKIDKIVVYSSRADNPYCTLLDYDLQYYDGDGWVTVEEVRTHCPTSDRMLMFDHFAQAWYLDNNFTVHKFAEITTDQLRLVVYRNTYGFAPDDVALEAMLKAWGGTQPQRLQLREIEIYGPPDPPAPPTELTATAVPPLQIDLSWVDNSNNEEGFKIDRSLDETTWIEIATVGPGPGEMGLIGDYYDNMDFTNLKVSRVDPTVGFDWGNGSPDPLIGVDTFSVRWTGQVEPEFSETYTFYTNTDDGVRLWVYNQLIIDKWIDQAPTEWSGTITLSGGVKYDILMEYYENGGGAVAQLSWSSPSQSKETIPQSRLYNPTGYVNYSDTDLAGSTIYYYRVYAYNVTGNSNYSNTASATTEGDTTPPAAPTGLTATSGDAQVSLDWADNTEPDLDGYDVYRSTTTGGPYSVIAADVTPSAYTDNSVSNGTTYYYVVTAVDTSLNESGYSNEAFATPTGGLGTGTILREWWTGISGTAVSDLTSNPNYPDNPSGSEEITSFEAPTDWTDNYGTRIRGYVHPGDSGSYTFWIAGDDNSELWLSTDENSANASLIANVPGWTNSREWTKYAEQQSSAISLNGGQKYYIEALHKEGGGGDNLAVAWQGPGISQEVIDGSYLSPWIAGGDTTPPAAPTGLTAIAGDAQVSLDWADNTEGDLAGYNVYRTTTPAVTTGLVAYWKLDESSGITAYDSAGTNTGTLMGNPIWQPTGGKLQGALQFDGDDSVEVADSSSISVTGNITLAAWVNVTEKSGVPNIMAKDQNNAYRWRLLFVNPYPEMELILNDGTGLESTWSPDLGTLDENIWYHVAVTVDFATQEVRYYFDGSLVGAPQAITKTGIADTAGTLIVGAVADWGEYFYGSLDDVRIYDRMLSASEIEDVAGGSYSQVNVSLVTVSNYTDTGLTNGTTYYYVVTAVDTSSNESGYSNEDSATPADTTAPAAPTGLSATPGDATVSLDWNDNGEGDLAGYNVYRSTTPGGGYSQINGSLLSSSDYTDNSVSNGTTYYYVVTAVDTSSNESGYSNEASATPTGGGGGVVFSDSFENGEWNGLWAEDSQRDWYDSTQRSVDGSYSAEVDGRATDAALTSIVIDLQGKTNATVTFSWLIESGLDSGEYLAFDVSTNGGSSWVEKAILRGNVDPENTWHNPNIDVTGISGGFQIRFRAKMSSSSEDADVDMVEVVAW